MHDSRAGRTEQKHIPSPAPQYAAGLFWLAYALIFPLYRVLDFVIAGALSAAVFFVCRRLFPGRTVEVPVPEVFAYTGDEAVDAILRDGRRYVADIGAVCRKIDDPNVRRESDRAAAACGKIFDYVAQNPSSAREIRRFVSYHLPTLLKMLTAYETMEEQKVEGENISAAMGKIEAVLKKVADAFENQLDKLFAGQSLDISADITVLEGMLSREGLTDSPINQQPGGSNHE